MSSFYGLNKCVQYASLIEIPAAVVQISIDRLQPLLKTSSNDMASLSKLTEPERNGLAHLLSPNFKHIRVNLFQYHLFLQQLTNNMTKYCSLNYQFLHEDYKLRTWGEHVVCINCSECQNKKQLVNTAFSELVVFMY